jgi:hypothetical protein
MGVTLFWLPRTGSLPGPRSETYARRSILSSSGQWQVCRSAPLLMICSSGAVRFQRGPGQSCSKLLHNWLLRSGLGKRSHIFGAPGAEASTPGNSVCRSFASWSMTFVPYPFRPAACRGCRGQSTSKEGEAHGSREGSAQLRAVDPVFQLFEESWITGGQRDKVASLLRSRFPFTFMIRQMIRIEWSLSGTSISLCR